MGNHLPGPRDSDQSHFGLPHTSNDPLSSHQPEHHMWESINPYLTGGSGPHKTGNVNPLCCLQSSRQLLDRPLVQQWGVGDLFWDSQVNYHGHLGSLSHLKMVL